MKLNDIEIGSDYCVGSPRRKRTWGPVGSRRRVLAIGKFRKTSYSSYSTRTRVRVGAVDAEGNIRTYSDGSRKGEVIQEVVDAQEILRTWEDELTLRTKEAEAEAKRNAADDTRQAAYDADFKAVVAIYEGVNLTRDSWNGDQVVSYSAKASIDDGGRHQVKLSIKDFRALLEAAQENGVDLKDLI